MGTTIEHLPHFRREIRDFAATARSVAGNVPLLPACPGWSITNIVMHLGWVHRYVTDLVAHRRTEERADGDLSFMHLPPEHLDWPTDPEGGPHLGPLPTGMLDWFTDGAQRLADLFESTDPSTPVGTWSAEQSVGFWVRMQTIEAAVHRWDAQTGTGDPAPIDAELAVDAIEQNFAVMVPAHRGWANAPQGRGETFLFHATDVDRAWTVRFDGDALTTVDGPASHEFTGSASDLALFLWHRINTGAPGADTWFTLAPPR
jgi:uncharacterized protein (TIGR03083 family)